MFPKLAPSDSAALRAFKSLAPSRKWPYSMLFKLDLMDDAVLKLLVYYVATRHTPTRERERERESRQSIL